MSEFLDAISQVGVGLALIWGLAIVFLVYEIYRRAKG